MFTGCMKESWVNKVTMHDVQPSILKSLIDYCYTGNILITEDNVVALIESADLFQVKVIYYVYCNYKLYLLYLTKQCCYAKIVLLFIFNN